MSITRNYQGQIAGLVQEYSERGQKEAGSHKPPTAATSPDIHETGLRSQAEGYIANEQSLFETVVGDARRAANDASSKLVELRSDIQQVLADSTIASQVQAELAGERQKLIDATVERIKAEVEWRSFRAKHRISDLPNYPESQIFHWSIVVGLIFAETIVNAVFYENNNGLIGGFFVAVSVAFVNMGLAVVLGNQFRRKNLIEADQKFLGYLCLVIFVPFAIFCNALFAAFRSVYQLIEDPSDPIALSQGFRDAWDEAVRIFILDYSFQDLSSFILFMIGIFLSAFAFWKGYTSDDRFPGHSNCDRRLKKAKRDEREKQELVKQRVKDFLISHRNRVQGFSTQTGAMISSLSSRLSFVKSAEGALHANAQAIQRDYQLTLDSYRQANLAIRGTAPPAYFTEVPDLLRIVDGNAAAEVDTELVAALQELEALQGQHRDALNEKLTFLQQEMAVILTSTYDEFISGVELEAGKRVQSDIQIMPQGK